MTISLLISGISGKLGKVITEEIENTDKISLTAGQASLDNKHLGKPLSSFLKTNCNANLVSDFNDIQDTLDVVIDVSSIDNFENKLQCRLINPAKSEVEKISKKILQHHNDIVRKAIGVEQWCETQTVIE